MLDLSKVFKLSRRHPCPDAACSTLDQYLSDDNPSEVKYTAEQIGTVQLHDGGYAFIPVVRNKERIQTAFERLGDAGYHLDSTARNHYGDWLDSWDDYIADRERAIVHARHVKPGDVRLSHSDSIHGTIPNGNVMPPGKTSFFCISLIIS